MNRLGIFVVSTLFNISLAAETLSVQQVLQQVLDNYPSVHTALLQVQRAQLEQSRVQGQLDWQLQGQAGLSRETSLFGTATDRLDLSAGVSRQLSGGGTLGFNANIIRDDAEDTFGGSIPNPASKTRLDVNYRHPLGRGANNPAYQEGLISAEQLARIAQQEQQQLYDQLATQVLQLYLSLASTQAQLNNLDRTIERSQRLQRYIDREFQLGLSEEKDVLQVKARLRANEAERESLQVVYQQQRISLNKLMGKDWDHPLRADAIKPAKPQPFDAVFQRVRSYQPAIQRLDAQIELAQSQIRSRRDAREDDIDLVMYLGNETNDGDSLAGDVSESELVGGLRLEYRRGLNKTAQDAELKQALLDREITQQQREQLLRDYYYDVASLLAEAEAAQRALKGYGKSVDAEQRKMNEAMQRYRDGRIETDRIIDYESQLASAELARALQAIELSRRNYQLEVLQGTIWQGVKFPDALSNEEQR